MSLLHFRKAQLYSAGRVADKKGFEKTNALAHACPDNEWGAANGSPDLHVHRLVPRPKGEQLYVSHHPLICCRKERTFFMIHGNY